MANARDLLMAVKEMLAVHLAEMKFVNDQMHVRMSTVARLVSVSAAFFIAMFITFGAKVDDIMKASGPSYELLAFAPVPFLLLGLLIAREQLLIVSHDKYFLHNLRPSILSCAIHDDPKYLDNKQDLGFLWSMSSFKLRGLSAIVSTTTYLFPFLGILSVLFVSYRRLKFGHDYLLSFSISATCLLVLLLALVLIGIVKRVADQAPTLQPLSRSPEVEERDVHSPGLVGEVAGDARAREGDLKTSA